MPQKARKTFFLSFILLVLVASSVFLLGKVSFSGSENKTIQGKKIFSGRPEIEKAKNTENNVTILFLGDLMFDRYIRQIAAKKGDGYIFERVSGLLSSADLAVANLEGPITENASRSIGTVPGEKGHLSFTFNSNLCRTLREKNIALVNLGNNHILNFGEKGLEETKKCLNDSGVEYFGYINSNNNYPWIKNVLGIKIGFINYNQFATGSKEKALENIKNLKNQTDIVVVYTHWGTEYKTDVSENIKNLAREFRVCERTIRYDIEELTLAYPLETVQGNGGGVKVVDGYFIGRKYLKPSQQQLLQKLAALLTGEDLIIMQSIFTDFGMTIPNERKGAKP